MKPRLFFILFGFAVGLAAAVSTPFAEEAEPQELLPSTLVTPQVLESKIAEVEAAVDLQEGLKNQLIDRYRKALSNLEAASSHVQAAEEYDRAFKTAPAQIQALRDERHQSERPPPPQTLAVDLSTPLQEIEQLLQKESADLAAVDARRADFERRLDYQQNRPTAISERLAQAWQEQEDVSAELKVLSAVEQGPASRQAARWYLETKLRALSAEIKMLDQELLSHSRRLDLLKAKRDKAVVNTGWIEARVRALSELVNRKRQLEAAQTVVEAEAARQDAERLDPVLDRLIEQNAVLTKDLSAVAAKLDALDRDKSHAEQFAKRIAADYRDIEATMETGGLTKGLGQLLVKHRRSLPDADDYARRARAREEQIAMAGSTRSPTEASEAS